MANISGNMASMAKEIETAQKRADKLKDKGAKAPAGKVATAITDVENASQQWNSQAPFVLEQLQAVDEGRINHLRDALTQFQTLELDQIDRSRGPAEQALGVILDVQTADEVKTFSLKTTNGKPKLETQRGRNQAQASTSQNPTMQPPPTPDDGSSQRSGSGGSPRVPAEPRSRSTVQEQKHGGLHGLKRLGTVLGRRKSTAPYARTSSPDRKSSSPNLGAAFSSFGSRGNKSRDADHRPASPSRLAESQIPSSPETSLSIASPDRRPSASADRTNGISPVPEDEGPKDPDMINGGQSSGLPQLQEPLQPTTSSSITSEVSLHISMITDPADRSCYSPRKIQMVLQCRQHLPRLTCSLKRKRKQRRKNSVPLLRFEALTRITVRAYPLSSRWTSETLRFKKKTVARHRARLQTSPTRFEWFVMDDAYQDLMANYFPSKRHQPRGPTLPEAGEMFGTPFSFRLLRRGRTCLPSPSQPLLRLYPALCRPRRRPCHPLHPPSRWQLLRHRKSRFLHLRQPEGHSPR